MSSESLTVEQTNTLRAQMGLPPLRSAPSPQNPMHPPPEPEDDSASAEASMSHLRSELARRKQARQAAALLSAPSLSQQLSFQTGGAATAWVERSRRVMEEEKAAASKRLQAEADVQRRQRDEANKYGSAHLRGLRVAHQYDEFDGDEQQATVLVLKDKQIGAAGDDMDELVNTDMEERGRKQRGEKDNERRKGRAWDEDMEDGPRLLGKYDEEAEQEGIVLGVGGVYGRDEDEQRRRRKDAEEREERLREGWGGAAVVTQEYDMSSSTERKTDSDYKQVKFKRKPKPTSAKPAQPSRTSTITASDDWINQLEQQALSSGAQSSGQQQSAAEAAEEKKERRVAGYLRALEKGEEETRRRIERDREEVAEAERGRSAATVQEVEDEDEELAVALAKARRMTARERESQAVRVKVEGEDESKPVIVVRDSEAKRMAERIRSEREANGEGTVKREPKVELGGEAANGIDATRGVEQDDGSIVFTSVSNFASGLQAIDEEDRVKRERPNRVHGEEEKADAAKADDVKPKMKKESTRAAVQQPESERSGWIRYDDNQPMDDGKEEAVKEEEEAEDEDEDDEEDEEEDMLEDEPLASEGVAAALALAKRRAYLSSSTPSSAPPTNFTLTQYDALGRELSQREQFRALSHAFHGQGAGWNKKDKRTRALRREVGVMRKRADTDVQDGAERALEAKRRLGQAFIVLEGNSRQTQHGGFGTGGAGAGGSGGGGGGGGGGTDSVARKAAKKKAKR